MSTYTTFLSALLCCGLLSTTILVVATGRIEGTVTDGSFKLEGVTVRAFPQENQKEPSPVPTDKNGFYQFKAVETGAYKLKYWKDGFKTEYRNINVSAYPPETKVPEVTMKPAEPGSVTGQTIDPNGNPVKTAVVQAVSADSGKIFKAEHDERGGFNIKLSEGTYQFIASAQGYLNAAAGVEVEANKTKSVTLILTPNPPRPVRNVVASVRHPAIPESAEPLQHAKLQIESGFNYGSFDVFDLDLVTSFGFRPFRNESFLCDGCFEQELSSEPARSTPCATQLRVRYSVSKGQCAFPIDWREVSI